MIVLPMKRFFSMILALVLCLPVSACAAEVPKENSISVIPFTDVPADADYAEAVAWCYEQGLMNGVSHDRFAPDEPLTRAMLVTVLHRAAGKPVVNYLMTFQDVPPESWYTEAVRWAASEKLVQGYNSSTFGRNDPVSVEQLQVILDRYLGIGDTWKDDPDKAHAATRAEVAVALYEALHTEDEADRKVLVAYFSCTNNTEGVAEKIATVTGGNLYEITPAVPYTSADLNYNTDCRANREQDDPDARPAVSGKVEDWENYDVVFLGYPIWWGKAPKIIHTFLESYDFAGKTVIPFCTSGSSPYNDSTIKSLVDSDTTWLTGARFSGGTDQSAVQSWVDGLGLSRKEEAVTDKLNVTFNGHTYTATMDENPSVDAFLDYIRSQGGLGGGSRPGLR